MLLTCGGARDVSLIGVSVPQMSHSWVSAHLACLAGHGSRSRGPAPASWTRSTSGFVPVGEADGRRQHATSARGERFLSRWAAPVAVILFLDGRGGVGGGRLSTGRAKGR